MGRRGHTTTAMRRGAGLRRFARRMVKIVVALVLLGVVVYAAGEWYKQRDFMPYFQDRRSELALVNERILEDRRGFTISELELEGANGIRVLAHLKVPSKGRPRHPVMVTLGGAESGREVIEYLGDTKGWMILALDYPYRGPTDDLSHWEFVSILPSARRAMLDTVPAAMMALDYLEGRGDVDSGRVVLIGGSFGALFAPAVAAAEERISAAGILFGAGDLERVIAANLEAPWPLRPALAWVGSVIVSPLEPLKYIGRISPRPVFFLSGSEDVAMPLDISRALHEAAGEPKMVTWLELGHVNLDDREFHQQVLDACTTWLQKIGFMAPDEVFVLPDSYG